MVLWLPLNVSQRSRELTQTHRKCAISALPEKPAIPGIKRFDPFRGRFLYLLDKFSLGKSSRQRSDNVNMISYTADVNEFGTEIAADCRDITVHARAHIWIEPGFAVLRAEDDVKNDFTEGLGHAADGRTKRRRE